VELKTTNFLVSRCLRGDYMYKHPKLMKDHEKYMKMKVDK
jgi:hypothetical protein